MEHWWNEIDRGKTKYSGKILSQYHFVHHKSHMDGPRIEPGPPRWEVGECRLYISFLVLIHLITRTNDAFKYASIGTNSSPQLVLFNLYVDRPFIVDVSSSGYIVPNGTQLGE
jgi:hypothetical protein